jgi:hypothetical protein
MWRVGCRLLVYNNQMFEQIDNFLNDQKKPKMQNKTFSLSSQTKSWVATAVYKSKIHLQNISVRRNSFGNFGPIKSGKAFFTF